MKLTFLFLAANPADTVQLRVDDEVRAVDQALRAAKFRDQVELIHYGAVRVSDLQELLLDHSPQLVHFSGHGTGETGIVLQDAAGFEQLVPTKALGDLFALVNTEVRCVVLNACYSIEQAQAIAAHIDCVVGIPDVIDDVTARVFATSFYRALGYGQSVDGAFHLACNELDLQALTDIQKPQLLGRADPTQVHLIDGFGDEADLAPASLLGAPTLTDPTPIKPTISAYTSPAWQLTIFFGIGLLVDLLGNIVAFYIPAFWFAPWVIVLLYLVLAGFLLTRDLFANGVQLNDFTQLLVGIKERQRWLLMTALPAAALWFASAGIDRFWPQPLCPPQHTCVLVARFALPSDPSSALVGETEQIEQTLIDQIERAAGNVPIHVQAIAPITRARVAEGLAYKHQALLVVWGRILVKDDVREVHFELTDRLGLVDDQAIRPFRIQPLQEATFTESFECRSDCIRLSGPIPQRTQLIAHFIAGLVQYAQEQPATASFLVALHCAGALTTDDPLLALAETTCRDSQQSSDLNLGLLHYYAGRALLAEGNYAAAERLLLVADAETPNDPAAQLGLAAVYRNWLSAEDAPLRLAALVTAERTLAQVPIAGATAEIQMALAHTKGLIAELRGNDDTAMGHYQAVVERFGEDDVSAYTALINLGRVQRVVDSSSAEETLLRAVSLSPVVHWAYLELAKLYVDDQDRAEFQLQQAAHHAATEPWVDVTWAQLCRRWEDFACVEAHYQAAIDRKAGWSWLHSRIGDYYRVVRVAEDEAYWAQAKKHYQSAVDLRKCDPWAHERLAYVLAVGPQPDYRTAAYHYQQARLLLHPDTASETIVGIENWLQNVLAKSKAEVDLLGEVPTFCTS